MRVQLVLLVRTLNRECKEWVDAEMRHLGYTMRPIDMPQRVALLRRFVRIEGARVVLPRLRTLSPMRTAGRWRSQTA